MKIKETSELEEILMELVIKYRDAVNHKKYLSVLEREADRSKLNEIYNQLQTIRQKILDSKCYMELGRLQKELSDQFLAEDTSPEQRLSMLAYIVRSLSYPILLLTGRSTISPTFMAEYQQRKESLSNTLENNNLHNLPAPNKKTSFSLCIYEITPTKIKQIEQEVKDLLQKYPKYQQWRQHISLVQAQILSQLVASGELSITVEVEDDLTGGVTTLVVSEGCVNL